MSNISKVLIGLAVLGFALAVTETILPLFPYVSAEGFSRASANLALIAIALAVCSNQTSNDK